MSDHNIPTHPSQDSTRPTRGCIVGNGQISLFAELRQKVCLYIPVVVLLRGLPSLDGKFDRFVTKKVEKAVAKLESDRLAVLHFI